MRRIRRAKRTAWIRTPITFWDPLVFNKLGSPNPVQSVFINLYIIGKKIINAITPKNIANHHFIELVTVGRYVLIGALGCGILED